MAGTVVADTLQAASTSTLVLKNGVASTPPTVQDSAGTEIGTFCRAWVNFNGTTVTSPASMTGVRGSFNVSSILDNGLGDYTINFTTAMPDANYVTVCTGMGNTGSDTGLATILSPGNPWTNDATLYSTTAVRVRFSTSSPTVTNQDTRYYGIAIFR